jgi:Protein ChrB, N-terminal
MAEFEWLLFLAQLPATPSSLRVNVWRRLREAGSASLQNGVWILPRSPENTVFMERLLAFVRQNGASGQIFLVQGLNQAIDEDIVARFAAERDQEYDEFLEQCEEFLAEIKKETGHGKFTFAELEENEQNFQRLRKWMAKIQKRDLFKTKKSQDALTAFQGCQRALQIYTRQVYLQEGIVSLPGGDNLAGDSVLSEPGDGDERD